MEIVRLIILDNRLGYLDFGEVCADKIVNFFQRNVSEKDKAEYHEYMREQENRRNLNHQCDHDYYRDSHNRRYSVVCYSFPCIRIHEERLVDSTGLLCWWNHDSLELNWRWGWRREIGSSIVFRFCSSVYSNPWVARSEGRSIYPSCILDYVEITARVYQFDLKQERIMPSCLMKIRRKSHQVRTFSYDILLQIRMCLMKTGYSDFGLSDSSFFSSPSSAGCCWFIRILVVANYE